MAQVLCELFFFWIGDEFCLKGGLGHKPLFSYTLEFAVQLRKITGNLSHWKQKYTKRRSSVHSSVLSVIHHWLADSQSLSSKATGEVFSRVSAQ
jgi:hypothetical protein